MALNSPEVITLLAIANLVTDCLLQFQSRRGRRGMRGKTRVPVVNSRFLPDLLGPSLFPQSEERMPICGVRALSFCALCFFLGCHSTASDAGSALGSNKSARPATTSADTKTREQDTPQISQIITKDAPNSEEPQGRENSMAVSSREEAMRLAEQHVALRKRSWGSPKDVSEQDGAYYVGFDTPEQELRLLGPRLIIIDKKSGVAKTQVRR